jgi:hypothetical protein
MKFIIAHSPTRRWAPTLALILAGAGSAAWWLYTAPPLENLESKPVVRPVQSTGQFAVDAPMNLQKADADARPADFSEADWIALNKAVEAEPDKPKERQRLVDYLRFQRATEQWRAIKGNPDVSHRQALARELLNMLPQHVANGELNTGETTLLLHAFAQDLVADPTQRQAWIDAQIHNLAAMQNPDLERTLAEDRRKNADFSRQQGEIVNKWTSGGPSRGDVAALETQLQALRERVYGSAVGK